MRPTIIRRVRTHDNPACLCGKCRPVAPTKDSRTVKTRDDAEGVLIATIPEDEFYTVTEGGSVLVYQRSPSAEGTGTRDAARALKVVDATQAAARSRAQRIKDFWAAHEVQV